MSRAQYLKSLERDVKAAANTINDLIRENFELRRMLANSTTTRPQRDEQKQNKN